MIAAATGLAVRGFKPFASIFAAFLTRSHDFIRMGHLRCRPAPGRLALRGGDRCRRPLADGAGRPRHDARDTRLDRPLPGRRHQHRRAGRGDDLPSVHQLPTHHLRRRCSTPPAGAPPSAVRRCFAPATPTMPRLVGGVAGPSRSTREARLRFGEQLCWPGRNRRGPHHRGGPSAPLWRLRPRRSLEQDRGGLVMNDRPRTELLGELATAADVLRWRIESPVSLVACRSASSKSPLPSTASVRAWAAILRISTLRRGVAHWTIRSVRAVRCPGIAAVAGAGRSGAGARRPDRAEPRTDPDLRGIAGDAALAADPACPR